jgi:GNAT superfamily N-acetyltransferase
LFVTRATRHDRADLEQLYADHDWAGEHDLKSGTAFIARDGAVVGALRLIEVEPNTLVVDGVLVKEGRRNEGIGRRLMNAAMTSRGGTMYLCCHDDRLRFYGHFGFEQIPVEAAPESVRANWEKTGDHPTEEGHEHFFMRAR